VLANERKITSEPCNDLQAKLGWSAGEQHLIASSTFSSAGESQIFKGDHHPDTSEVSSTTGDLHFSASDNPIRTDKLSATAGNCHVSASELLAGAAER